jgi:translocation and assembly module TamB
MGRFFTRRKVFISLLTIVALLVFAALTAVIVVRLGYLDQWLAARVKAALGEYGVRTEIGSLHVAVSRLEVELRDLKLHAPDAPEAFVTLDRLAARVTLHDWLGFNRPSEVRLRALTLDGLRARYTIDAQGRSNLAALHRPPERKEEDILFTYAAATSEVRNSEIYYVDRQHKLDGVARNLLIKLTPEGENDFRVLASAEQSSFVFDGRESSDLGFQLNARANEDGAVVDALNINSPLVTAELKGELKDWRAFNYRLAARAEIKLGEVAHLVAPQTKLTGAAHFEGQVQGQGVEYRATGKIRSNQIMAQGVRIAGLRLSASATGKGAEYATRDELTTDKLDAAGFRVNRFIAAGRLTGLGEDFSWLGNFRVGEVIGQEVRASGINFTAARVKGRASDLGRTTLMGRVRVETFVAAEVPVGSLTGEVTATRDEIKIPDFSGEVFGGTAQGNARVRLDGRESSSVLAELRGINLDQAAAVAAGERLPLRGTAEGRVNLAWQRGDYRTAEGAINLKFTGNTLRPGDPSEAAAIETEGVPVNGELNLVASDRLLRVENTVVQTGATRLALSGELSWERTGTLEVALDANDAAELQMLALDFAQATGTEEALQFVKAVREREVQLTNKLSFHGRVTGSLDDPQVRGRLGLDAINLHDELLGGLTGELMYGDQTLQLEQARLTQAEGGRAEFAFKYPFQVENGGELRARLEKFALGPVVRIFATPPVEIVGEVTGHAAITGLPEAMRGQADYRIAQAKLGERALDEASGRLALNGTRIEAENLKLRSGTGQITGAAALDTKTKGYRVSLRGEGLEVGEFVNAAREVPLPLAGRASVRLEAESRTFELGETRGHIFDRLEATIASSDLRYRGTALGQMQLVLTGRDSVAKLDFTAQLLGHNYAGAGEIDFSRPEAPVRAAVELKDVALEPVLNLIAGQEFATAGAANGQVRVVGNLLGESDAARLEAEFTQLAFELGDYRLTAQPPVTIKLSGSQVDVSRVQLSGTNTNLRLEGSLALGESGRMGFSASGDVNLRLLQSLVPGLFADGLVRIQASAGGTYQRPRFSGTATLEDGSLRSAELPLALSKARGRLLFTADQTQIESFSADMGGGKMSLVGGAAFVGLRPDRWRFQIRAQDVRIDYPPDTRTTLDGDLELQGNRQLQVLGGLVNVRRADYLADVDLFEFVERMTSEFSTPTISATDDHRVIPPTQLDIRVVADDSLVLHTKSLDIVAGAALRLRGPVDDPSVGGRITITRGIIDNLFNERYRIASGFIEFSGVDKRQPRLSIEAETEVLGYRLIVLVVGPLDQLRLTPRSEPPLPQADVVALLTSGQLANEGGTTNSAQALAQTSVNTIASLATQPLSRRIESNVTGRLFGLNRFSIDPLLTGRGTDPTARITVGRRVTRDLSITYSTNLASNQDQVILIEYRASDRISFVASRAQDGTFGLDVRLRKRF